MIYVGKSSLEKSYTISLLAKVTSNTMVLASSVKTINCNIVRKNIKKKERTLIVYKPENINEVESIIIKLE